jgi:hypothetical protein
MLRRADEAGHLGLRVGYMIGRAGMAMPTYSQMAMPSPVGVLHGQSLSNTDMCRDGKAWQMRACFQDDQGRHDTHPVELQHLPFWTALVHVRMRQVQTEDMPAMHCESLGMPPLLILCWRKR